MENEKHIICPNCEQEFNLEFQFCPHCGQKNKKQNLNFKYIISEFLSANFNVDSKIYLTLRTLITKPGKLTSEYLSGKRTKYITPIRLYVLISFVYFFVASIDPMDSVKINDDDVVAAADSLTSDTTHISTDIATKELHNMIFESDSTDTIPSTIENLAREKSNIFQTDAGRMMFKNKFAEYFTIGLFVLIPIAALILFLFFSKGTYYIQHLVFSFHLQSMIFLVFTFFGIVELFYKADFITILKLVIFIALLFIWIKKYYKTKVFTTIWKMFGFITLYWIVFFLFFLLILVISFFNLESVQGMA